MSAVAIQATVPYYAEGLAYWDELTLQCRCHAEAINRLAKQSDLGNSHDVAWRSRPLHVTMARSAYPSTEINLSLTFEQWGPKISASVRGYEEENLRFYPEDFDFVIGSDEHGQALAISGEGRSLSPHELAKYVAQNFRRCYPGLSLPSPEGPYTT